VLMGQQENERRPSALVIVVDAANLDNHLRFTLELLTLGLPSVVALNMVDLAARDGLVLDPDVLARELGVPVIPTVAVRKRGLAELIDALASLVDQTSQEKPLPVLNPAERRAKAHSLAKAAILSENPARRWTQMIDSVVLHPIAGPVILAALLFTIFQAVFSWASIPVDLIQSGVDGLAAWVTASLPEGIVRSALTDGVIAGVGAVLVFLPLILILFAFILALEMTGYMVRAAFLMDRVMARVGLSGRAFIPLLSSFACAVPGIMATRTIEEPKDRLTTILIAPLMTCSARLPVYTIIIAAFIPQISIGPGIGLQGLVLFGLYLAGIIGALFAALLLRHTVTKGAGAGFLMEMPKYQWPHLRDLTLGLWQRVLIFLKRAGTIIAVTTVVLWALLSFPRTDPASGISQSDYSIAGRMANGLAVVLKPIGFNRDIALALIPAMAAREVAVSALATTYAVDSDDVGTLGEKLKKNWPLPTALAFLVWFVFAPQCISTIAVVRRETNGWKWPLFMVGYLFALAYLAAGATFWIATYLGF
jgi:ferrous iron transport protein B